MFIELPKISLVGVDGNTEAKILIVGDAPDGYAIKTGLPFANAQETILMQCLHQVNLVKHDVCITNLIWDRTDLDSFWRTKGHKGPSQLKKSISNYVFRLNEIIARVKPKVIVALGDITTFALLQRYDAAAIRGYPFMKDGICIIPSYAPKMMVWSNYEWRHYLAHDLLKAKNIVAKPELLTEPREQVIPENFNHAIQLLDIIATWKAISFDIEVANFEVSCIGHAMSKTCGITIPIDMRWTIEEEVEIWKRIAAILENKETVKIAQNGVFDCQFLAMRTGIFIDIRPDYFCDTMVAHHLMFPDMKKGLGFLASIHTYQRYWKDEMKHKGAINKEG